MIKFNKIMKAGNANLYISHGMREYQKTKRAKNKVGMQIAEQLIIASGGSLQQAQYPSDFLFLLIGDAGTQRWQARRDAAQSKIESILEGF